MARVKINEADKFFMVHHVLDMSAEEISDTIGLRYHSVMTYYEDAKQIAEDNLETEEEVQTMPRKENGVIMMDTVNAKTVNQSYEGTTQLTQGAAQHGDDQAGVGFNGPPIKSPKRVPDTKAGVWRSDSKGVSSSRINATGK